jgi:hypothetical protein
MNINFLQFYYKLTQNKLYIDNKTTVPPPNITTTIFKNAVNICYINSIFHILRTIDKKDIVDKKSNLTPLTAELLDLIEKHTKTNNNNKYTEYFLYDFKEQFRTMAIEHFTKRLEIPHPHIAITNAGGIALQLLCSIIIPSITTKTIVKYKSDVTGDQREFNYLNINYLSTYTPKTLLNSRIVNDLSTHIQSCDGVHIKTDSLFSINFNHDVDFPYDVSNRPGLGLSTNYLHLDAFSDLNTKPYLIKSPEHSKYFQEILADLIQFKIVTVDEKNFSVDKSFRLIEEADPTDLNKKNYIFEKDGIAVIKSHKPISHMSFYVCNNCNAIFPYKSDTYHLSFTSEYIIMNKYRQIEYKQDITAPLTFTTTNNTKITYKPIAYTCAFKKDHRLNKSHIIAITLEKNNNFYLYEDERIPIQVNPNDFNVIQNEIIIFYKLQSS